MFEKLAVTCVWHVPTYPLQALPQSLPCCAQPWSTDFLNRFPQVPTFKGLPDAEKAAFTNLLYYRANYLAVLMGLFVLGLYVECHLADRPHSPPYTPPPVCAQHVECAAVVRCRSERWRSTGHYEAPCAGVASCRAAVCDACEVHSATSGCCRGRCPVDHGVDRDADHSAVDFDDCPSL